MNLGYAVLILLHILLFVYWLGADLGVFYSVKYVVDPSLSLETPRTVMKVLHFIDLFPRMTLVLMLPIGATLALAGGYATLPPGWTAPALAVLWIAGLAWFFLVVTLYGRASPGLLRLDYGIRYTMIAGLLLLGIASLAGYGPVAPGIDWLPVKLIIYALIVALGLGIRAAFKPFAVAFGQLVTQGSTPEIESAMRLAHARVRPVVLALWAALVIEAFLGISKI
jgi:hypothetical protein